jgi:hypothetical protein
MATSDLTEGFCRLQADNCRRMAAVCNDPAYERSLRRLADDWDALADRLVSDAGPPTSDRKAL